MARRYKRKANGQFAGGGGTAVGGKGGGSKAKMGTTKRKSTKRQKIIKFAAQNPRLVVGLAGSATVLALNGRMALNDATAARKISNSNKFKNEMRAAVRGVGGAVGSKGLKAKRQTRRGVYKL